MAISKPNKRSSRGKYGHTKKGHLNSILAELHQIFIATKAADKKAKKEKHP